MRSIAVDIDNTLWDFAPVFYERLRRINPDVPPPSGWTEWDFWEPYVNARVLYDAIHEIHLHQLTYAPYAEARSFLTALKERGCRVIIASHRRKDTAGATMEWLGENLLPYDELHLSYDKSAIFDRCWAVVDDSPVALDKANKAGLVRAGLLNPWNALTDHPLFPTLGEVLAYLETKWPREKGVGVGSRE